LLASNYMTELSTTASAFGDAVSARPALQSFAVGSALGGGIGLATAYPLATGLTLTSLELSSLASGDMPLGMPGGDKWVRTPSSIQDQMTLSAAQSGAGVKIIDNLGDQRFLGMEKWEYKVKSAEGNDSVVHYVRDPDTGELMDFKFKKRSTD
ncbi:MAG: hypothetical protein U0989_03565, partial [Azonexus sp.]|nr:hypothetical protein [Azonexus sp.]